MDLALCGSVTTTMMKPATMIVKPNQTQTQLFFNSRRPNLFPLRLRCSPSSGAGAGDAIILHVGGMMCEGCASTVKRILESRPQVSSATVNLASQTATVLPAAVSVSEEEELGEALAHHLTTSGFTSTFPPPGQEDAQ